MYCHDYDHDGGDHYDHGDENYDDFDMIIIMVNRARKLWNIVNIVGYDKACKKKNAMEGTEPYP